MVISKLIVQSHVSAEGNTEVTACLNTISWMISLIILQTSVVPRQYSENSTCSIHRDSSDRPPTRAHIYMYRWCTHSQAHPLTVIDCNKAMRAWCSSVSRACFFPHSWASWGLSVWPSPFLITPESARQLLLFHIYVCINQGCGTWMGS